MRIDGYYNRMPIGLSDNPEEAAFSFAMQPYLCMRGLKTNSLNNPMKLQHEKTRNSIRRNSPMPFVEVYF